MKLVKNKKGGKYSVPVRTKESGVGKRFLELVGKISIDILMYRSSAQHAVALRLFPFHMTIFPVFFQTCTALLLLGLLLCSLTCTTTAPVDPTVISGKNIQLSLFIVGNDSTEYTGTPITAILQFSDSVIFNDIDWYLGTGQFIRPNVSWDTKFKYITVPIFWNRPVLPITKDTLTKLPFDTIYVKVGPDMSNVAKVMIKNRAPVIDSLIIADTSLPIKEIVFTNNVFTDTTDTAGKILMRIVARDFDNNTVAASWRSIRDSSLISIPDNTSDTKKAVYTVTKSNFRDSIIVDVYDGQLGNVNVSVVLVKISGDDAFVIDSIKINTASIPKPSKTAEYEAVVIDTLQIQVFFNGSSNARFTWEARAGKLTTTGGNPEPSTSTVRYVCTKAGSKDTLKVNTKSVVDTISFITFKKNGDMSNGHIILIKRPLNKTPILDSAYIDSTIYIAGSSTDTIFTHSIDSITDITITAFAHDPENDAKDAVTYKWTGNKLGTITPSTGATITYTPKNTVYNDTLLLILSDSLQFTDTSKIIIVVNPNQAPYFEHIRTFNPADTSFPDTVFTPLSNTDIVFYDTLSKNDTFKIAASYHDANAVNGDKCSVKWYYKNKNLVQTTSFTDTITYISALSVYTDSVAVLVTDTHEKSDTVFVILTFE